MPHDSYLKRRAGKPPTHAPILNVETGEIFYTFVEAAAAINGDRKNVARVCYGVQSHHKGYHFIFMPRTK